MNVNPGKTQFSDAEISDLRARVRAKMTELGRTQAQLGREADISSSSLSQWFSGTYNSEPGRTDMARALTRWLNAQEVAETLRRSAPKTPPYQPLAGSTKIMGILSYARVTGELVVVAGHPGVSKSAAALQYRADNPLVWYAPMDATMKGGPAMLIEILAAMGEPEAKGTPAALLRRICSIMAGTEGLLIIDEAQHLSDLAIETLRAINDRTRVGVVILGNEGIYTQIGVAGGKIEFAQVASRVGHREFIIRPDPADAEAMARAWADVNEEVIGRREIEFCREIAAKTGGLRNIEKTFRKAIFLARTAGEPLELGHLQGAFAQASGAARR